MTTFLILLLFAIIFLVAGGALLYFRIRTEQKAAMMGQTETSGTSDVSGLAPGALIEDKGILRCEEPLTSEMAGERCAYYSSQVIHEYLEEGQRFVFSHRPEEALEQSLGKTVLWLGVGGMAALVVGVILLVIGVFALTG